MNVLIHQETKLPCSWNFYKQYVARSTSTDPEFYLRLYALCGCGGKLFAACRNPLKENPEKSGLTLEVLITDARMGPHDDVKKRPIKGQERAELGERMVSEKLKASRIRKEYAGEHMKMFDIEPVSENVQKANEMIVCAISAIRILKYSEEYRLSIFDLGDDPFFVEYFLPEQMRLYNEYNRRLYSRIIMDASGDIVRKIPRPVGMSGHLFLYEIVISIPGEHEGQAPVAQMISERQNTIAISHWLENWLLNGASKPNEIVIDFSAAFLLAVCKVFAGVNSRDEYIDSCFLFMLSPIMNPRPAVLIRIDVAHFIAMITKWKSVKAMKKKCKEFFIRCVYLVVLAKTLQEAKDIIQSILLVSSCETEGFSESTGDETPCETHKRRLLDLIGKERPAMEFVDAYAQDLETEEIQTLAEDFEANPRNLHVWIDDLFLESTEEASSVVDGDRDNLMFDVAFRKAFLDLCYKLPLWSNILARAMASPYETGVGASVESYFNDLKHNLITEKLRVDIFLQDHIDILKKTMILASGLNFFHKKGGCVLCLSKMFPEEGSTKCTVCGKNVHDHSSCSVLRTDSSRICIACNVLDQDMGAETPPDSGQLSVFGTNCSSNKDDRTETHGENGMREGFGKTTGSSDKATFGSKGRSSTFSASEGTSGIRFEPLNTAQTFSETGGCNETREENDKYQYSKVMKLEVLKIAWGYVFLQAHVVLSSGPKAVGGQLQLGVAGQAPLTTTIKRSPELGAMENWRNKGMPSKKKVSFYGSPCPELKLKLNNNFGSATLKPLHNGGSVHMALRKIGKKKISLNNTCAADSIIHACLTAYCDSPEFRGYVDGCESEVLQLVRDIAVGGVNAACYQKRAQILYDGLHNTHTEMEFEIVNINCKITPSACLKAMKMPPSCTEEKICSSKYCPAADDSDSTLPVLSADPSILCSSGVMHLQIALERNLASDLVECLRPFNPAGLKNVPKESGIVKNYPIDLKYSKNVLCGGTLQKIIKPQIILFIQVIGKQNAAISKKDLSSVEQPLSCKLMDIPVLL
ncbi:hypothetical protein FOCC_FOCC011528 [Frankliniella occidentalis]|nr:hypothetical protein FOCC_FOCC011528 [Frankliniella occidentalis]